MKSFLIIFFGLSSFITTAQITGQFYMDGFGAPVIDQFGGGDLEGNFSIAISADKPVTELVFDVANIKFKITNIPKSLKKLNLGIIELPMMKSIDISEYKSLSAEQKSDYYPVYHYANLLGYEHKSLLDKDYILFTCNDVQKQVKDFSYEWKAKMIIIDANKLTSCN